MNGETEFLSWQQAHNLAAEQLREAADKRIMDDIRRQNKLQLSIQK